MGDTVVARCSIASSFCVPVLALLNLDTGRHYLTAIYFKLAPMQLAHICTTAVAASNSRAGVM